jgi:hypothetical protein
VLKIATVFRLLGILINFLDENGMKNGIGEWKSTKRGNTIAIHT